MLLHSEGILVLDIMRRGMLRRTCGYVRFRRHLRISITVTGLLQSGIKTIELAQINFSAAKMGANSELLQFKLESQGRRI
jgi:hypothetical protein